MWGIVINPVSGKGKGARKGVEVISFFAEHRLPYKIISGVNAADTSNKLQKFFDERSATGGHIQGLVAVGGDGLAHLVLQKCALTTIPVCFIPAGTGNDFVRSLGWPVEGLHEILRAAVSKQPSGIDLGLVDGEWFGAILSTGFDSLCNERANALTWPKGPMKYNVAMALELPLFKPRKYTLTLDDQVIQTEAMLIAIGNSKSYGGGMLVCPGASLHDGLFDVMILKPVSIPTFLRIFPRVFKGTHIQHPAVKIYRAKTAEIDANAVAYADGERIGSLPVRAECISQALLTWSQ